MNFKKRIKNPYFIFGLISVIFLAADVNVETLTNWLLLKESIIAIFMNPVKLASVAVAITGVVTNPTTKGITD